MQIKHASLFTGIGGFDLAAEWMGWKNVFQVENDEYCTKLLKQNFPNAKRYGDINQFDATPYRGTIDIITGGFPCQPFSHAGKRKGENDNRYLWPQMLRVIKEVKPPVVIGENVAGLLSMENGSTLKNIFASLENEEYTIETFIIPACAVGAWHRRDRIWVIAYTTKHRLQRRQKTRNTQPRIKALSKNNLQFITNAHIIRKTDGIPNRVDRIKGLGNAIVPQIAFELFKAIQQNIFDNETFIK